MVEGASYSSNSGCVVSWRRQALLVTSSVARDVKGCSWRQASQTTLLAYRLRQLQLRINIHDVHCKLWRQAFDVRRVTGKNQSPGKTMDFRGCVMIITYNDCTQSTDQRIEELCLFYFLWFVISSDHQMYIMVFSTVYAHMHRRINWKYNKAVSLSSILHTKLIWMFTTILLLFKMTSHVAFAAQNDVKFSLKV